MGEPEAIDERHVHEFERLRRELLDLTRRNPMLNYKHSPRSRQHLRIVDTTLEFALSELLQSRTPIIKALPDPDDIPRDEKTPQFLAALNHAKLTDIEYLIGLESLEEVARQEDPELAKLDRTLRNRVREQLGLAPSIDAQDISTVEHARSLGINPNFALSDDSVPPTRLSYLQTMFFADELDARVGRIAADARLSEQEMGLSTLFLAFGFLRWFDGDVTEIPNFAPLLLLPVQIKKETVHRQTIYKIQATPEEPEINLSLREMLRSKPPDIPRELPLFDSENDGPESYFAKVQEAIDGLQGWRIDRYLTLGQFAFGRLAMFADLAPENWKTHPVATEIIGTLMRRNDGGPVDYNRLMFAPDHDVDDHAIENEAPLVLSDADASQHSAVVDVMRGRNLVIEGPPGTGKSQTITNIIANALFKGNTILFLSDKLAALEVVERRLHNAGFGDFCLELHSHKAQAKEVIESLRARCQITTAHAPNATWQNELTQLRNTRGRVGEYLKSLHCRNEEDDASAFELFWSAIAKRTGLRKEIHVTRHFDLEPIWSRTFQSIHDLKQELEIYATTISEF